MDLFTDVVAPPPDAHTLPAPPSYNISLNLSSILAFLPSRLLSRIIWKSGSDTPPLTDSGLPATTLTQLEAWASSASGGGEGRGMLPVGVPDARATAAQPGFPSPWGFFTSGYMLGLFVMAVLLHRMQNVVIPSRVHSRRHHLPPRLHRSPATPPQSPWSLLHPTRLRTLHLSLLPLDLSRTSTRLALHLPSLYFLSKTLLLWFLLVLQTADIYPALEPETAQAWHLGWIATLGAWGGEKQMSEICWSTFCAICGAFVVEGFVKGLDGIGGGFPLGANMNPNTSPFNLVGYAFLLHVYSSPITHIDKGDGFPSRPDKHVIITIIIPLLQLTIFHYLSISKRLSTHRLLPTALTSLLSLLHFHMTLFSHLIFSPAPSRTSHPSSSPSSSLPSYDPLTPTPLPSLPSLTPPLRRAPHPYSMPLLNYIPNTFETALILTIALTMLLNALVQLLVRGRVERVFSGLGVGGGIDDNPHAFHLPYDEDFGVLLLRVGAASLEATGLRGWGNEVAPIPAPLRSLSGRRFHSAPAQHDREGEYGLIHMGRTSVSVTPQNQNQRQRKKGLRNEVRTVDLGVNAPNGRAGGGWLRWVKELWAFLCAVGAALRGLGRGGWRMVKAGRKRRRMGEEGERDRREVVMVGEQEEQVDGGEEEEEKSVYGRFLRGENISDDEGDMDVYSDGQLTDIDEEESDLDAEEEEDREQETEAVHLLTDLVRGGASVGGEMVLAHLLHPSGPPRASGSGSGVGGPLTRRRWGTMVSSGSGSGWGVVRRDEDEDEDDGDGWGYGTAVGERAGAGVDMEKQREREDAARSWCVVCTIETREIICWPCRCLSMCDNCREALASRSAPTKHRCPCCRQTVEGYSRIYIP